VLPELSQARSLSNAVLFSLLFLAAAILALNPNWFDRPVVKRINRFTTDWQFANVLPLVLSYPMLESAIVVSSIWYCWFSGMEADLRARIVSGTFAAIFAALISHFVRRILPTSPKPIFDPVLQFHLPSILGDIDSLRATSFREAHTFPSDRATLFAGLAIAILIVRPEIGLLALGCTMAAEISRIYLGHHYPTDIIGSFSLAASLVWLAQIPWGQALGSWFVSWECSSAATFYVCAFLLGHQLMNGFQELRELCRAASSIR
jgi:membrane-associated phospholipid phosphatase